MPNKFIATAIARRVALRLVRLKKHRPIEFHFRSDGDLVRLPRGADTELEGVPGAYSLRFYERRVFSFFRPSLRADFRKLGHAVVGEIEPASSSATVVRRVVSVHKGNLSRAMGGWISGWLGTDPADFAQDITLHEIKSSDGWTLPCWLQLEKPGQPPSRAGARSQTDSWIIHVHGRGASPAETARNFAQFQELGFSNLAITYRNDGAAHRNGKVVRGALGLGTQEWVDLEAAVAFAKTRGARQILVFGWSYGAAISLQFARHSALAADVGGFIFDSPVISWRSTLAFQVRLAGAPISWAKLGENYLRSAKSSRGIGLNAAIDFADFETDQIASHLNAPILILHSRDDGYIPIGPCEELSEALPETVTLCEFQTARHCKLYNFDRVTYQSAIEHFIQSL